MPESILLKPGPLDPAERKIMEQHPIVGERICAPLRSFRNVLPIIRSHHEKQDGTGYPDHMKGEEIPLTARILQTVGHLRFPHHRPPLPGGAFAGKNSRNHVGGNAPRVVGCQPRFRIGRLTGRIADGVFCGERMNEFP